MNATTSWRTLLWIGAFSNHTHDYVHDLVHSFHFPFKEAVNFLMKEERIDGIIMTMLHTRQEIAEIKRIADQKGVPFFLYTPTFEQRAKDLVIKLGIDDYCFGWLKPSLMLRIDSIRKLKTYKRESNLLKIAGVQLRDEVIWPAINRSFDIIFSSCALIVFLPILSGITLTYLLASSERPWAVSSRVGFGYKIFNLYKFNTAKASIGSENSWFIYFMRFLKSSGLDQMPALVNVLKGEMSMIGDSPLNPLEAEKMTGDQTASRFKTPAGITGLWRSRVVT